MSTGLIVAIVIVAIIIIALLVLLPRMRSKARTKQAERELHHRRERVADEHRTEAHQREREADMAERRARMAQQEAERERAEANLRKERAEMHERGMADDELIEPNERDRFEGVTPAAGGGAGAGAAGSTTTDSADRDGDGHTIDDRARAATGRDDTGTTAPGSTPGSDYERGREDERRLERERITDDVRDSERSNR